MDVRLPDGTVIQNVPDGTTKADLVAKLQRNGMAVPSEWLQSAPPTQPVQEAGQSLNRGLADIPRQLGLTARYALEGPAQAAQVFTEPIANLMRGIGIPTKSLGEAATGLADTIGLPTPQTPEERVYGTATKLLAGGGGMLGASRMAAQLPGVVGMAGAGMAANPTAQLTSATGAGLMGGLSQEGGGNELQQTGAALLGGVAGGLVPSAVGAAANAGRQLVNRMTPQAMDVQISNVLQRAGMDYSQVPERVRQSLRQEMQGALRAGRELDPAAVRRLAEFQAVGATPTRGMITQDPVQITREMNLAKVGANASDEGLQGLARVQNQNNARLIQAMNEQGAARGDMFRAGQSAIDAIQGQDARLAGEVSNLYGRARDTAGRSAQLNGAEFTRKASQALDEGLLGGSLPKDVENHLNRIASGEVPFNVDYAEQLKTRIGALQRASSDGSTRMALGVVRRALDDTSLMPSAPVNPGNLPMIPGSLPPTQSALGQESINAFNQARQAARSRFAWQESGRPVAAAVEGAQPDKFIQQFVVNGTVADARNLASNAPVSEVRDAILNHLKDKAIGGASDEIGKFSQSAFNRELNKIGDRKLSLFFSPEELGQLKMTGRVASYMQNQPVGSAVNNSNSGALLLGRGVDLLNKVPVVGPMVGPALQNINIGMQQRAAQNIAPGLLAIQPRQPIAGGLLNPALSFSGGLLSPQEP